MSILKSGQTITKSGGTDVTYNFATQQSNVKRFEVSTDPIVSKRKLNSRVVQPVITSGRPGGFSKAVNELKLVDPYTCADGSKDENYMTVNVSRNAETSQAVTIEQLSRLVDACSPGGVFYTAVLSNTQVV
jgi:hypothetical protein